jgi:hypothetical protein
LNAVGRTGWDLRSGYGDNFHGSPLTAGKNGTRISADFADIRRFFSFSFS